MSKHAKEKARAEVGRAQSKFAGIDSCRRLIIAVSPRLGPLQLR